MEIKQVKSNERERELYHGLSLGVERSDKIRSILLLEADAGSEGVTGIVLEDAAGGVINENQTFVSADVSKRKGADDISPYGLDLMRFAPVDVGPTGHPGRVEDVGGLDGGDIGFEGGAVLEAAGAVGEVNGLSLAELAEQAPDPASAAVDEKLERLGAGVGAVGWETHWGMVSECKGEMRLDRISI